MYLEVVLDVCRDSNFYLYLIVLVISHISVLKFYSSYNLRHIEIKMISFKKEEDPS